MNKILFGTLMVILSFSALADDKSSSTSTEKTVEMGTTYKIKSGYKFFRLNCGRWDYIYANEYTLSKDKKELIIITEKGEWIQIINTDCRINMVK